jgi:Flp pilus assembly protein TadD
MPTRSISPLLHRLLTDPVDDIRLLAYGMLETIEKTLTQRITAEQSKLLSPISEEERYRSDKALAQAYKELVYSRIVQGDVRRNAAEQADTFARSALGFNPLDAGLWQLRGLLALEARRADDAEAMFRRAVECGFPRQRLLPYLAEIAYLRGDYVEIRSLFSESKGIAPPLLASVVAYWNS